MLKSSSLLWALGFRCNWLLDRFQKLAGKAVNLKSTKVSRKWLKNVLSGETKSQTSPVPKQLAGSHSRSFKLSKMPTNYASTWNRSIYLVILGCGSNPGNGKLFFSMDRFCPKTPSRYQAFRNLTPNLTITKLVALLTKPSTSHKLISFIKRSAGEACSDIDSLIAGLRGRKLNVDLSLESGPLTNACLDSQSFLHLRDQWAAATWRRISD